MRLYVRGAGKFTGHVPGGAEFGDVVWEKAVVDQWDMLAVVPAAHSAAVAALVVVPAAHSDAVVDVQHIVVEMSLIEMLFA